MSSMTPKEIVSELDRHIVGQADAKRAVAIALRNRWRRQQVDDKLRGEITPKNILMIGPTGVGKTEIARRLARLANAPFIKVEATKFTEVGYVGRDVDTIIRDLVEVAVKNTREHEMHKVRARAQDVGEERVLHNFDVDGAILKLWEGPVVAAPGVQAERDAVAGFRWVTMDVDDLDAVVGRCEAAGASIPMPVTERRPGLRVAIVQDPDGNLVELVEQR